MRLGSFPFALLLGSACNTQAIAIDRGPGSVPALTDGKVEGGAAPADAGCPVGSDAGGDFPCDVEAALRKCQICHQQPPKNHAPWPLLNYEDTQLPFGTTKLRKWQRMAQVIEPGNFPHMPPNVAPQLTAMELQTLAAWFADCAPPLPEGSGCDLEDAGAH